MLLAVASAALAAGVMASTASTATASATGPAASTAEPLAGAPPFFAGPVNEPAPDGTFAEVVKIFSSATGATAATVPVPAGQQFFAVARLGDDQHFVAGTFDRDACVTHLWTLAIDTDGQPGPLTPLAALPQVSGAIEETTSSADGTALAFNLAACEAGQDLDTVFINLPSGQITRWVNPQGRAGSLSLTADGKVLGFALSPEDVNSNALSQVFTMPTDAPAGPLLSQAHQVPGVGADRAVLSPSGDQLWVEAQARHGQGPVNRTAVTLSLFTTSTGALVRKVAELSPAGRNVTFTHLALDNAGQHLLSYGGNPGPGHADVEEIDLASGQTLTFTITNPIFDSPLTTFAW